MSRFFDCVKFFYWNEIENAKNNESYGQGNPIPFKMMFGSATLVKNCGRRCIFSGQSAIFQGREKHIVK